MLELAVEKEYHLKCATCEKQLESRNALHRHLRREKHLVVDSVEDEALGLMDDESDNEDDRRRSEEQRRFQAQRVRRAVLDHVGSVGKPECCDDLTGGAVDMLTMGHPGPRLKRSEITQRNRQWGE